ncbi:pyrroloquinoline quinone biosynthesis protein D [Pararhizobium capsulatum DSM 1112]|uniref:Pyrroloquinoline quinone biosynthesis protein D n=1 Tax=Pararhizobium capsulatum DSM 1112 TaxID=1121113 RepID=A0ABU0BYG6_9HYPH|nr:pyrroloquinoline quinone biosynthesis peptide chaperone PqqD [Pararhizobium capsulatum]MDQ0323299.1 pyrroloquinoline quinone biosynthesis protein D [Pararhizobium capsulatum DSM 1112]
MRQERTRTMLSSGSAPVLKPHVRLQYDPVRQAWAVLSPEKVFWPDEVSLDILRLCDGRHSVTQILEDLAVRYDAPHDEMEADVEAFLQEWSDRFLVAL